MKVLCSRQNELGAVKLHPRSSGMQRGQRPGKKLTTEQAMIKIMHRMVVDSTADDDGRTNGESLPGVNAGVKRLRESSLDVSSGR